MSSAGFPAAMAHRSLRRARLQTWLPRAVLLAALMLHGLVVHSLLVQPLDINARPAHMRPFIWSFHHDMAHRRGPGVDFFALYHAGLKIQRDESPYDKLEAPHVTPYFYPYRYLPVVARTLGQAVTHLPPDTAYRAWMIVLEATLAGLLLLFWTYARARWLRYFSACVLLLSSPYYLELHVGQFTFLTLALVALLLVRIDAARSLAARTGLVLIYASSVLLKMFPMVLAPMLIPRRLGKVCVVAALSIAIGLSYPYFSAHPEAWERFQKVNFNQPLYGMDSGNFGALYLVFQAIREKQRWSAVAWGMLVSQIQLVVLGLTCLAVMLSRCARATVQGSTLILAYLVCFGQVWEHHHSGMVVMALLLLSDQAKTQDSRIDGLSRRERAWRALALMSIVVLAAPTPYRLIDPMPDPKDWDPSVPWPAYLRYVLPLSKAGPMVVLWLLGLYRLAEPGFAVRWKKEEGLEAYPAASAASSERTAERLGSR